MSLNKLISAINQDFDLENKSASELLDFITVYAEKDREQYQKNKQNRAIHFGKWKGFTIKELSVSDKGRSYVEWLLTQQWFEESKYPDLFEDIKACNIKKKNFRRAVLE